MSNKTSIADYQQAFATMLTGAEANAADLLGTEEIRDRLGDAVVEIPVALAHQASLKSQAQQATRDLEDALAEGKQMYSRLRNGILMRYTPTSEKLVEFGLQPRRTAVRVKPPLPEIAKPSESGPNPTPTAASETDGTT